MRLRSPAFWFCALLVAALLAPVSACSLFRSKRAVECEFAFRKDALTAHLTASADLNYYKGQSYTAKVVFYELSDSNAFLQMLESPDGVNALLEGRSFDDSVLAHRQLVIHPSETRDLVMDRAQGARYVGVVAGFFNREGRNFSRLYDVPTHRVKSMFGGEKACYAENLAMTLELGRDGFIGKQPEATGVTK